MHPLESGRVLIVPDRHPSAVLHAIALAQAASASAAAETAVAISNALFVLADKAIEALLQQSATPIRVCQWEWPSTQDGLGASALALRFKWRKRLAELKELGLTHIVYVSGDDAHLSNPHGSGRLAQLLAEWLALPLEHVQGSVKVPVSPDNTDFVAGAASVANGPAPQSLPLAPRLFAHADALARVAHRFRHTPASRVGSFRMLWVLPHADAVALALHHADALSGLASLLATQAVHLHLLRVVADDVSPLLLARDSGLTAWAALLQQNAAVDRGCVVDLGSVYSMAGAALLVAQMAHADVVISPVQWVGCLAQGLNKAVLLADGLNLLRAEDISAKGGGRVSRSAETAFYSDICSAFPFIVKP